MVLTTGKPEHNASIAKRGIVQRKLQRTDIVQSSSGSNSTIRKENRNKPSGGTKILADVLTRSRVRTTPTSLRGPSGRGVEIIGTHKVGPAL